MQYSDTIRSFILSTSTAICDNSSFFSYLIEQLFTNIAFLLFVIIILVVMGFIVTTVYIRKRGRSSTLLSYVLGALLFYLALNIKVLTSFFKMQMISLDEKIYNSLVELSNFTRTSFLSSILVPVVGLLSKSGKTTDCESKSVLNNQNNLSSSLSQDLNYEITNNQKNYLVFASVQPSANTHENNTVLLSTSNGKSKTADNLEKLERILQGEFENTTGKNELKSSKPQLNAVNNMEKDTDSQALKVKKREGTTSSETKDKSLLDKANAPVEKLNIVKHTNTSKTTKEADKTTINNIAGAPSSNTTINKLNVPVLSKDSVLESQKNKANTNETKKTIQPSPGIDNQIAKPSDNTQPESTPFKKQNALLKYKLSNKEKSTDVDNTDDKFFKKILLVLDSEFTSNNIISSRIQEIAKVIEITQEDILKLDDELKKLIKTGSIVAKEMQSFNVYIDKYDPIRIDMVKNLKKLYKLKSLHENLSFKNGSDKNFHNIFKLDNPTEKNVNPDPENIVFLHNSSIQLFLIIEFIFVVLFLYFSIVGHDIFYLKLVTVVFLFFNAAIGILLMVGANFYDKDCILGRIPGCDASFSKNFTNFARTANIDLNPSQRTKLNSLETLFDKIQTRSAAVTANLSSFFEEDYVSIFYKHSTVFKNLINKIKFVKDDFTELTHSKVNKKDVFTVIDSVSAQIAKISANMRYIDKKFLLELYTREAIFSNFITTEKENVIDSVEKQLEGATKKQGKDKQIECVKMLKDICDQKVALDNLSLLLIFGSIVFGICLIF